MNNITALSLLLLLGCRSTVTDHLTSTPSDSASVYDTEIDDTDLDPEYYISTDSDWISVKSGWYHTCGLRTDGTIECWGCLDPYPETDYTDFDIGQCTPPPGKFTSLGDVWSLYPCAIDENGVAECWSDANIDNLNHDLSKLTTVEISTATYGFCIVTAEQQIECWGETPDPTDELKNQKFSSVSAGADFITCGLLEDQTIACWNAEDTSFADSYFNTEDKFVQFSVGQDLGCGVSTKGEVICSGNDTFVGQYGEDIPPEGISFTKVSIGLQYACGIDISGLIHCWGEDLYNKLDAPEGEFVDIDLGGEHACALRTDGRIVCWGLTILGSATPP